MLARRKLRKFRVKTFRRRGRPLPPDRRFYPPTFRMRVYDGLTPFLLRRTILFALIPVGHLNQEKPGE